MGTAVFHRNRGPIVLAKKNHRFVQEHSSERTMLNLVRPRRYVPEIS